MARDGPGRIFNCPPEQFVPSTHRTDRTVPMQSVPLYNIEGTAGLVPLFTGQTPVQPVNYIHIPNLPKCDGAIYIVGDSMYPLLKSGDIVLYKQMNSIEDIFWGDMYLLSIDIDGESISRSSTSRNPTRRAMSSWSAKTPTTPTRTSPWTASKRSPSSRPASA